jgi:deoxycytidine triphosphate deaminase
MVIPPKSPRWTTTPLPISGLSERELNNPEGIGYDLRVEEVFVSSGRGHLGNTVRETPSVQSLGTLSRDGQKLIALKGGEYYLVKTVETVQFGLDMGGLIFPRSTLFRSGVLLQSSVVPPGYVGTLTFGLAIWSPAGFDIELGARFAHMVIVEVGQGASLYGGQWNGGRVTTESSEEQK